jgi:hypothetical protein
MQKMASTEIVLSVEKTTRNVVALLTNKVFWLLFRQIHCTC